MDNNLTVLGFDFGMKSIGVAVGQAITGTAAPLPALKARDGIPDWTVIEQLASEWQPQRIVVGLPLNMDGSDQHLTHAARKFANRLHSRLGLPVETCDERLTTVDAKARLFDMGGYKKLQKGLVDSASACLIVESYLDTLYD
ncbi:Holliday junction resolvase RuvX [Aestuariibacter halophilus]|uniref:Putative pre-16S rRNA nuclease n=1 Tax=Fluctibacter halophilus TaxID=226011 RepID=A0ABS8GBS6_9ALTE|nr:Holliday junction resolvase RuvX [Aestuariibacter halophilus]MCC2618029.1 Holliday junction resolvase RuvX [Aestuariibacter halophilus]